MRHSMTTIGSWHSSRTERSNMLWYCREGFQASNATESFFRLHARLRYQWFLQVRKSICIDVAFLSVQAKTLILICESEVYTAKCKKNYWSNYKIFWETKICTKIRKKFRYFFPAAHLLHNSSSCSSFKSTCCGEECIHNYAVTISSKSFEMLDIPTKQQRCDALSKRTYMMLSRQTGTATGTSSVGFLQLIQVGVERWAHQETFRNVKVLLSGSRLWHWRNPLVSRGIIMHYLFYFAQQVFPSNPLQPGPGHWSGHFSRMTL